MIHPKTHPDPSIIAKDAFRGIRFALKRGAKLVVEGGPRQLPSQFEEASNDLLNSAESLAKSADKIAKQILGLEFNPSEFCPPSFANSTKSQRLARDASNLFFGLTLAAKKMNISNILVSETLCARLIAEYARFDRAHDIQDTSLHCAELYGRLIEANVLGDPPGVQSQHNCDRQNDVKTIAFATTLWIFLERGSFEDNEEEILQICCDVTMQKSSQILNSANNEDAIRALFEYALCIA